MPTWSRGAALWTAGHLPWVGDPQGFRHAVTAFLARDSV